MVARKKTSKAQQHRWRITLIKSTPARYLGSVDAPDEQSALDEAAKEFRIDEPLRSFPRLAGFPATASGMVRLAPTSKAMRKVRGLQ